MMKLIISKKGLNTNILNTAILAIVLLVVLFQLYSALIPEAQAAGDSLGNAERCSVAGGFFNTSQSACLNGTTPADTTAVNFDSIPLSNLFSGTGIVFIIIMAALLILVVTQFMPKGR